MPVEIRSTVSGTKAVLLSALCIINNPPLLCTKLWYRRMIAFATLSKGQTCKPNGSGVTQGVDGHRRDSCQSTTQPQIRRKVSGIIGESTALRTYRHRPYRPYLPFRRPFHLREEPFPLALLRQQLRWYRGVRQHHLHPQVLCGQP